MLLGAAAVVAAVWFLGRSRREPSTAVRPPALRFRPVRAEPLGPAR